MLKKQLALISLLFSSMVSVHGVGDKSSNITGRDEGSRYNVVFEGVLTTQEGHVYKVNEINFNKLIRQIPVFEMPSKESYDTLDTNARLLKKNPAERLEITKLDLAEISIIQVPSPDVVWYYKKAQTVNDCSAACDTRYKISEDPRASKYLEIKVTDKEGEIESYLVEANKRIYCSEITASGPKEKDVQLPAIKTLTITGYHKREDEKESKANGKECICPEVKKDSSKDAAVIKSPSPEAEKKEPVKTSSRNKRMRSTKIVRVSQAS